MFSLKSKLDTSLRYYMSKEYFKKYRVIIKYKSFSDTILKRISSFKGTIINKIDWLNLITAEVSPRAIDRLIEYPEVEYVSLDGYCLLCGTSVASANNVNLGGRYKFTGRGIGIGIVDTGVFPHPDLLSPMNKIRLFVDLINDFKYPYDDNGHGTFISGILCGSGGNSDGLYKGIADKANLYCYKAFNGTGKGYVSDILFAINSLISSSEDENIRLILLPFELANDNIFYLQQFDKLLGLAISKNLIPIVPSGSNPSKEYSIRGLATLSNCLTIGGLDTSKTIKPYSYSSAGPVGKLQKPEVSAGCVNIQSLNCDKNYISERNGLKIYPSKLTEPYATYSGTSCSAAYVCGVCALLLEKNPLLTFNDIRSLLQISADSHELPRYAEGDGTLNLDKLLT
ncbi:S8 family serine peptidase [Clostridium folliculivorans]|uniref:Peptidase n=1 Tax=Clostridium folliculivorans TaxID=2886038 RepID=A0A9W6DBM6_9CLOT|nr:S8 family serine peptidase [Clostridium folliculivorans]GKU25863.1 peptidase [Clostridium folliculivorans]GKU27949.1 peptidase [Clostridium folliculivorans]